jgi:hypothetical protein
MGALAPPRLVPTHDVTIDYLVHPGTGRDQSVRVSIEAGGGRLRIVGEDLPVNVLVDRQAGLAHVLVPLLRAYTSLSITRYDPERTVLRHASFSRAGSERLAGGPCTDWLATSASGSASACITDGGVILKGEVTNRHGRVASLMATAVDYAPLPAWTWSLPGDYHDLGPLALDRLGLGSPR